MVMEKQSEDTLAEMLKALSAWQGLGGSPDNKRPSLPILKDVFESFARMSATLESVESHSGDLLQRLFTLLKELQVLVGAEGTCVQKRAPSPPVPLSLRGEEKWTRLRTVSL